MNNLLYYLGFSYHLGIGPYKLGELLKQFKTPKAAYEAPFKDLIQTLSIECATKFDTFRKKVDLEVELNKITKLGIKVFCQEDEEYPEHLRKIPDAPICLYVKGNADLLKLPQEMFIAVVGTRDASSYGLQIAKEYATEFAELGRIIVSGMALGIDGEAHKAALTAKAKTIAVMGHGLNYIYPSHHRFLYQQILDTGGAVVSEFRPGQVALPGLFITRNRIISGLSKGVLVVEGKITSGALSTGRCGLAQDRDVFCIPGSPNNELAQAPNQLIKENASLVTDVSDVYLKYNITFSRKKRSPKVSELSENQLIIFSKLLKKPLSADEISERMSQPIDLVLSDISRLEILGEIERNDEGKYQIL